MGTQYMDEPEAVAYIMAKTGWSRKYTLAQLKKARENGRLQWEEIDPLTGRLVPGQPKERGQ